MNKFLLTLIIIISVNGVFAQSKFSEYEKILENVSYRFYQCYFDSVKAQTIYDELNNKANSIIDTSLNMDEFLYKIESSIFNITNDKHVGVWRFKHRTSSVQKQGEKKK